MEPIRVLHVLGGLNRGGAESMVMNLYRAVDKARVQFDFLIHAPLPQDYSEEILAMGGRIYVFPRFSLKSAAAMRNRWTSFFREHPEYKILHSHVRSYASLYIPIAHRFGLTTIVHSHSTSNGKGLSSAVKKIMQYPLRYRADYLFACSDIAGEWLYGRRAVKTNKYKMIPNAVDTERYVFNKDNRIALREELGISDNYVFGHVGRLCEAKNHAFLLEVFEKLKEKIPNAVLVIVGEGELREEIEVQIKERSLEECVKMLGSRSDVPTILSAMDVFLFPSKWEGLPVTVVEAQASGLPCFVSDTVTDEVALSPLVQYLPINRGTGPWVDAILASPKERLNVQEKIIAKGFDINSSAKELTEFYMEIVNSK